MSKLMCALVGWLVVGCSDSTEAPNEPGAMGDSTSTAGTSAGGSATAAGADSGGGGGGGTAGATAGAPNELDAPDHEAALLAFLDAKSYAGWAKEAEYHASTGPHGDGVRVYYSPKAAAALTSGAETFPAGAASVKELTSGASLYGYAVWVKVQDATDGGNGFFWYEVINQGGGKKSVYGNALGSNDCVGCHSAGKDYDLSTLPFE